MMDKVSSSYTPDDQYTVLWLIGKTTTDRRLLTKIITALADEINARLAEDDWRTVADLAIAGADLIQLRDDAEKTQWEAEDEAI